MRKFKKNVLILTICSFFLVSCQTKNNDQQNYQPTPSYQEDEIDEIFKNLEINKCKNQTDPVLLIHGDLIDSFDKSKYQAAINEAGNIKQDVINGTTNVDDLIDDINLIVNILNELNDVYAKITLYADIYNSKEGYEDSNEAYALFNELYEAYINVYIAICRSDFRKSFYPNMSDEQIEQQAKIYEERYTGEVVDKAIEMSTILNNYYAGKADRFTSISNYIKAANDYAELNSYTDYLSYAYPNVYGRDYSIDDTSKLTPFIKNYIVPLNSKMVSTKNSLISYAKTYGDEYKDAYNLSLTYDNNFFGSKLDELLAYAKYIGGDYLNNFVYFLDKGSYYFSNVENPNTTGYISSFTSGEQYMFLGKDYQGVSTLIHEFGHYNAGITFGSLNSYDTAETQSQGNELMFYSYLSQNDFFDELTTKYLMSSQLNSMLSTIIYGYAINEVEKFAYSNENFTKQELENKWVEVGNSIGLDFSQSIDYLYLVLLNYQGYYISYAMSAVAALELYALSLTNLENAKTSYKSIYTKETSNETFTQTLKNANLFDVFDEDAYKLINNCKNF